MTKTIAYSELLEVLRKAIGESGSQAAWASNQTPPISPAYISDVLAGRRKPGALILRALGYERETVYRKISA